MRLISSPSMLGSSEAVEVCSILVRVLMFSLMHLGTVVAFEGPQNLPKVLTGYATSDPRRGSPKFRNPKYVPGTLVHSVHFPELVPEMTPQGAPNPLPLMIIVDPSSCPFILLQQRTAFSIFEIPLISACLSAMAPCSSHK
jgi:hypothetical protein